MVWFFMIAPFIKIYKATSPMRDAFKEAQKRAQEQHRRANGQETPKHKKKIDPNVGEYVQFTEVSETRTAPDGATATTQESQITDVTWEDL